MTREAKRNSRRFAGRLGSASLAVAAFLLGCSLVWLTAVAFGSQCTTVYCYGNDNDNTIDASGLDNFIYGYGGADDLLGRGGVDEIVGGGGDDYPLAGDGWDYDLYGNNGYDKVDGEGGNDDMAGGDNNDQFEGQQGDDLLVASDDCNGGDVLFPRAGIDECWANPADAVYTECEKGRLNYQC